MDHRRNHSALSLAEKTAFVNAVLALKNEVDSILHPGEQKRYDDFVEVHKNAMIPGPGMFMPMPHRSSLFFPWHRVLLRQFELALQAIDSSVTIPYWDWSLGTSDPFTPDFLGGDGDPSQGDVVTTGPFAFARDHFPVRVWDGDTGDAGLRRHFGDGSDAYLPTPAAVKNALRKTPYSPGPASFEVTVEGNLHNPVHNWVGGNMADATSPNDPVFFLHHAYIDYLWSQWRAQNPNAAPYLPSSSAPGFGLGSTLVFNNDGQPVPWKGDWKIQEVLDTAALGYQYA